MRVINLYAIAPVNAAAPQDSALSLTQGHTMCFTVLLQCNLDPHCQELCHEIFNNLFLLKRFDLHGPV